MQKAAVSGRHPGRPDRKTESINGRDASPNRAHYFGAAILMAAILAAMITWWTIEASHAPAFMRNGIGNGFIVTSSTFPPALIMASILMLIGLAAAIAGTLRVAQARRASAGTHLGESIS